MWIKQLTPIKSSATHGTFFKFLSPLSVLSIEETKGAKVTSELKSISRVNDIFLKVGPYCLTFPFRHLFQAEEYDPGSQTESYQCDWSLTLGRKIIRHIILIIRVLLTNRYMYTMAGVSWWTKIKPKFHQN